MALLSNQISRENESNDQANFANPLDPNWNSDNTLTSSHYSNDNIMYGNLSSKGDYDRYWVYMDANERIQLKFTPPENSSYELLFLNEANGELVKEEILYNNVVSSLEGTGNVRFSLYYTAPIKKVYHLIVRAAEDGPFSSSDYKLSIGNFINASPSTYTSLSGIDSPDLGQDQIGTSAGEILQGTLKDELIKGNNGDDTIYGNGGSDVIRGGEGNDIIYAGSGRNTIYIESGTDIIFGGEAIDTLIIPDKTWTILRGVDVFGKDFSKGVEYIWARSEDGLSITKASSIEMLTIADSGEILSLLDYPYVDSFFSVERNNFIDDLKVKDKKIEIDLSQYMMTVNPGYTTEYSANSNNGPLNSISINNNILTIKPIDGFEGNSEVTILARNINSDGFLFSSDKGISDTFMVSYENDGNVTKKYTVSENINNNFNILSSFDNTETISKVTQNYSKLNDVIMITNVGTARGLEGDDLYFISDLITNNAVITIADTKGKNIIQIPKNTFIEKAIISSDAARITLSDNKQITINNADKFTFNLGGNISSGEAGVNLNFEEFALIFDVNILDISSTVSVISDFYI